MTIKRAPCLGLVLLVVLGIFFLACSNNPSSQNANSPVGAGPKPAMPSGPPAYEGYLDLADCDSIYGWVYNASDPNAPVDVDIYEGNVKLATVKADGFRQDLLAVGKGNGNHAFGFVTPPSLKDGKPHSIQVKITGTAVFLGNSPRTMEPCLIK